MDRKMMRCLSAVAVSLILIIGLVLGPTVDADAAPVVPAGFEAAVFARVTDPFHLAFDGDGNLFVGRDKSGSGGTSADAVPIHKVSPDGSTVVEFGAAIPDPDGVIVDIHGTVATLGANSVLVASLVSGGKSRITQISPDGSTTLILVEGEQPELTNPQQLAFDSSGKLLWVNCDPPDLEVEKGTVGSFNGSTLSVFGTVDVETCLGGIAIDPDDGRVFVSDFDNGKVKVFSSDGTLQNANFVGGLSSPDAMAFDTTGQFGGKLFVVERGNGQIRRIDPATGGTEVFATGFARPFGLAFGPDGCLFVSEFDTDTVWRICRDVDQVILTPPAATNPVGTDHTVTATVTATADQPVPDITVQFLVEGSVSAEGSCTTDENGQCDFTYAGPQLPGADLITAYADTNDNNVQDPDEPAGTATKAWVLPTSTPGHVTGGGHILAPNLSDEIAFGFNARSTDTGFSGHCNVIDPSTEPETHIKCIDVTSLVQTPTPGGGGTATFFGNATVNDVSTTYRIDVTDVAEPGAGRDSFRIQTSSGYTAGGLLTKGNIQVHR